MGTSSFVSLAHILHTSESSASLPDAFQGKTLTDQIGKTLIAIGLSISLLGGIIVASSKLPWLKLGRLPGDVYIQRDGFSIFFPMTTMLLLSAVLSLILFVIGRVRR
jgi:hypothetical protein